MAALSGSPQGSGQFGLPDVRASTGGAAVFAGVPLTVGAGTQLLSGSPVPVVKTPPTRGTVAALHRTVQPDLLVVAPFSLPDGLLAAVRRLPGMLQAERVEAV